jgi:hypothetical protein
MNISSPEKGTPEMDPKTENSDYLKDSTKDFDKILAFYGDHHPK